MRRLSCAIVTLMLAAPVSTMGAPAVTAEQAKAKAAPAKPAVTSASPVNINTASSSQIEVLPGIGARTAERIVEYRQKNGGFKKIEEIRNLRFVSVFIGDKDLSGHRRSPDVARNLRKSRDASQVVGAVVGAPASGQGIAAGEQRPHRDIAPGGDRAPACHAGGRGFESRRPHQHPREKP